MNPFVRRGLPSALLALVLALTGVPARAQLGWSDVGWSARCVATSPQTRLTMRGAGLGQPPECHYEYRRTARGRGQLVVSAGTRRAVEAVMDDIARWFEGRGFPAPQVRRTADAPVRVRDSAGPDGRTTFDLAPADPGRDPQAFEVLIDPRPSLRGRHAFGIAGFYSASRRAMVMRVDPARPDAPEPPPDPRQVTPPAPVQMPARLPTVDPDTLAHEMFHAISYGLHGGNAADFVEEGLAEMFGNLYRADRSGLPAPHPLTARFGEGRFTRAPLMSVAGTDAYDAAPFWRYVHDRTSWPVAEGFVRLLREYDLNAPVEGSASVDFWLETEFGRDLNTVWRDFLHEVSREAARAGVLDTLVECRGATMQPAAAEPERVFEATVGRLTPRRFTAICLRLALPLVGQPRELRIESRSGGPIEAGMHLVLNGAAVHEAPHRLESDATHADLIVFPWLDDRALSPSTVEHPGFRVVVEGLAQGCGGTGNSLRNLPTAVMDRVAAAEGVWQHFGTSYGYFGPAPQCARAEFTGTPRADRRPFRFATRAGS